MCESCERWAKKSCPYGVGYPGSGLCRTSDCGAWRTWDTRGTVTNTEEVWKDHRPGWFSDWKVVDSKICGSNRSYWVVTDESEGKGHYETSSEYRMFLWSRTTHTSNNGSIGATCGRLNPT